MLRFQRPPDVVFQAILRDSLDFSIDCIDILTESNEYDEARVREAMEADYPRMAKVFTPLLARTTLWNLRKRLDRPEIYSLNNYHYLLLFEIMAYYADIHNGMVEMSESREERINASLVDPFYIGTIDVGAFLSCTFSI